MRARHYIAVVVLVVLLTGGTGYAATRLIITSKSQIAPKVLRELHGAKGEPGPKGEVGEAKFVPLQGLQGERGLEGKEGHQGNTGPQGYVGPQGATGSAGPVGPTGPSGGPTGPTGATGPAGPSGTITGVTTRTGVGKGEGPIGAVATCPEGMTAIGGGVRIEDPQRIGAYVTGSYPDTAHSWTGIADSMAKGHYEVQAYVLCK